MPFNALVMIEQQKNLKTNSYVKILGYVIKQIITYMPANFNDIKQKIQ
jgi:hypothetical protein